MLRSESIAALAEALATAQGQIEAARKDASNPHLKSKYATLASVWDACRKPLSEAGLCIVQTTETCQDGTLELVTTLLHKSGEWIRTDLPVKPVQDTPQGLGSALTYARRYSLSALVGVAPDDDDAEEATRGKTAPQVSRTTPPPQAPPPKTTTNGKAPATPEQVAQAIETLRADWPGAETDELCAWAKAQGNCDEALTALRGTWAENFQALCLLIRDMEHEVYPVEKAIINAREKHLPGKTADADWTHKDLAQLQDYRVHLSGKLDAQATTP